MEYGKDDIVEMVVIFEIMWSMDLFWVSFLEVGEGGSLETGSVKGVISERS